MEEKQRRAKEAQERREREKKEKAARKKALVDITAGEREGATGVTHLMVFFVSLNEGKEAKGLRAVHVL